ncbi:MAG: hypothetical protein AB7I27_11070 [Bacteriovoracaceae bacterium]
MKVIYLLITILSISALYATSRVHFPVTRGKITTLQRFELTKKFKEKGNWKTSFKHH